MLNVVDTTYEDCRHGLLIKSQPEEGTYYVSVSFDNAYGDSYGYGTVVARKTLEELRDKLSILLDENQETNK